MMERKILISCQNCKYFEELKGGIIGECRFNPPLPHPAMYIDENDIQEMTENPDWWIYPVVKNKMSSWCGRFASIKHLI